MPIIVDGPELSRRVKIAMNDAHSACFAVAFWGRGAADEIGIREEMSVRIVCNLLSGGTNPSEIRTLIQRGASVRQLNNLHSKIGVVDKLCFLGSSNMSTNGLGSEGSQTGWLETNIVFEENHSEFIERFEDFWARSTKIEEIHLLKAQEAWAARRRGDAAVAAIYQQRSIVDVLRDAPEHLDALNVQMVVYDRVIEKEDIDIIERANIEAQKKYGEMFETYWDWSSMATEAQKSYLIDFDRPARGQIAGGEIYRRNTKEFPDFQQDGETFNPAFKIDDIEGITVGAKDKVVIRAAFYAYVRDGAIGEGDNFYNFPISELAPYIFPKK
ncbi:phospholipase D family protein [Acetobacter oeni]|uniref:Uncharacterized protein n=1 Tax=Acetobacter oeni TaxID=304077 RepID=A0A511XQR5_9PROT|nr:phospholipase D family protein [Acetobacter oeni]MBB3884856.1 hypothetical protein [Acetobacter oeni]NHO20726.1 hypothetical protein [Acetobacter oeni]GBR09138.1 hypothetical protein AA21952_2774 [Acetobacter oeni LMG 21952]GEN65282.1 hypothetical protein AOE01nite_35060 [Acetobacter oeni]